MPSARFLTPARRRRLIHSMALYVAGAWVVLQVVETVASLVPMPEWLGRVALVVAVLGLPLVAAIVLFAEAEAGDAVDDENASPAPVRAPPLRLSPRLLLLAAVLLGVGAALPPAIGRIAGPREDLTRLAILPFSSAGAGTDEVLIGLTDAIRGELAQVPGLQLMGPAGLPADAVAGGAETLGAEIDVGSVLEGSVRRDATRLRVELRLYSTSARSWIWSKAYDVTVDRVPELPGLVTLDVVRELGMTLGSFERSRVARLPTSSPDAFELMLRASTHASSPSNESYDLAIELLRRAITLDPDFALAHAQLATVFANLIQFGGGPDLADSAYFHARRAVALDPYGATGYSALGLAQLRLGRLAPAREALERSIEINPNQYYGHNLLGVIHASAGDLAAAIPFFRRAAEVEPARAHHALINVGTMLLSVGLLEDARIVFEEGLAIDPSYGPMLRALARVEMLAGRGAEAVRITESWLNDHRTDPIAWTDAGEMHLFVGDVTRARAYFEKAVELSPMGEGYNHFAPVLLACALRREGRPSSEVASVLADFVSFATHEIEAGSEHYMLFYGLAGASALVGDRAAALQWLERAVDAGWIYYDELMVDPVFATLREDPGFRAVAARVRAEADVLREEIELTLQD